jgi:hypothetical protein
MTMLSTPATTDINTLWEDAWAASRRTSLTYQCLRNAVAEGRPERARLEAEDYIEDREEEVAAHTRAHLAVRTPGYEPAPVVEDPEEFIMSAVARAEAQRQRDRADHCQRMLAKAERDARFWR